LTAALRRRNNRLTGMRSEPGRAGTKADEREGAAAQFTTLASRIPQALHRRVKLFCFEQELRVQDLVAAALEGRLHRAQPGPRKAAR